MAPTAAGQQQQDGPHADNQEARRCAPGHDDQVITSMQLNSRKVPPGGRASDADHRLSPAADQQAQMKANQSSTSASRPAKAAKSAWVLDPSNAIYHHWSMIVSLAFLYNFWSLSYRFAFREINAHSVAFWFALDYSADLIYVLDVVVNFHTGYLEDGVLQRDIKKIGQHYRECTLFYLDCFCLLPLDILYLSIGYNSILRCTRLVKIYKFWAYVDRTERHTNYPNVIRTFALVHYILVIFHWNACLFYMISKNKLIDLESLYRINDNRCDDVSCQYLHAFYWSTLALTTVGDLPRPRAKGEFVYVIVELFFGLFLFASVLGHVANIVTNVSAARKEFQAKLDAVKTFMRIRRVSDDLQSKVIRWFDYLWISQKSSDEERSVACLPDRLKAEIAIHVHLDTLKRVDIFQNTEAGFLCELVLRLKPVLFSPGDYVCRKGEVGHEMYIVSRGILEVVQDGGKQVVATLKAGSYFGEISVLSVGSAGNRRTASVRSVGYSVLFCLNKRDMWDVLRNYPNAEARIRSRAEERLVKLGQPQQHQQQQVGLTSTNGANNVKSPAGCKLRPTGSLMGCEVTKGGSHRRRVHSSASSCQVSRSGAKQEAPNIGKYSRCRCSVQPACRKCIGAHHEDDDHHHQQHQQEADEQDYVCPLECCDGHHDGGRRRRAASRRQQQQPASRLYATSTSSSMQPITGTRSLRHRRNEQHEHRHQHRHHYHHKSRGPIDECCVPSTAARQASLDGQPTTTMTTTTISPTVMKTKRAVSEMIQRDSDEDEEDADDDEDGDEENDDDDDDDDSNDLGHPDQWHSSLAAATTANDHSRPSDAPAKRAGHQLDKQHRNVRENPQRVRSTGNIGLHRRQQKRPNNQEFPRPMGGLQAGEMPHELNTRRFVSSGNSMDSSMTISRPANNKRPSCGDDYNGDASSVRSNGGYASNTTNNNQLLGPPQPMLLQLSPQQIQQPAQFVGGYYIPLNQQGHPQQHPQQQQPTVLGAFIQVPSTGNISMGQHLMQPLDPRLQSSSMTQLDCNLLACPDRRQQQQHASSTRSSARGQPGCLFSGTTTTASDPLRPSRSTSPLSCQVDVSAFAPDHIEPSRTRSDSQSIGSLNEQIEASKSSAAIHGDDDDEADEQVRIEMGKQRSEQDD